MTDDLITIISELILYIENAREMINFPKYNNQILKNNLLTNIKEIFITDNKPAKISRTQAQKQNNYFPILKNSLQTIKNLKNNSLIKRLNISVKNLIEKGLQNSVLNKNNNNHFTSSTSEYPLTKKHLTDINLKPLLEISTYNSRNNNSSTIENFESILQTNMPALENIKYNSAFNNYYKHNNSLITKSDEYKNQLLNHTLNINKGAFNFNIQSSRTNDIAKEIQDKLTIVFDDFARLKGYNSL